MFDSCRFVALALLLGGVARAAEPVCRSAEGCRRDDATLSRDSLLLQTAREHSRSQASLADAGASMVERSRGVTSDCASRLNHHSRHNSACVVTRNNQALLVWVPYGSRPGWDLPGGMKKGGSEAACETAERETCEETGHQVRAVKKLTSNVFRCEIVAENVCRKAVDEGFLKKKWAAREDLESLQYRGGTWGDKKGFLRSALGSSGQSSAPQSSGPQPDWRDACGCKFCHGEGFSSTRQRCTVGKTTEVGELRSCMERGAASVDACGCQPSQGQGWSSRASRCAQGSHTEPREACNCQRQHGGAGLAQIA